MHFSFELIPLNLSLIHIDFQLSYFIFKSLHCSSQLVAFFFASLQLFERFLQLSSCLSFPIKSIPHFSPASFYFFSQFMILFFYLVRFLNRSGLFFSDPFSFLLQLFDVVCKLLDSVAFFSNDSFHFVNFVLEFSCPQVSLFYLLF